MSKAELFLFILLVFSCTEMFPQASIGVHLGGGVISGNSPDETSFSTSVFVQTMIFPQTFITRLSFLYMGDFNLLLLKSSSQEYYPFIRGISLKAIFEQYLDYPLYIEEGIGFVVLNDRIFSDRNNFDYGIAFSITGGFDLRKDIASGFRIGGGIEYGLTFTGASPKYFSIHFQTQYLF